MNSPMNAPDYKEHHQIETLRPVYHDWTTKNGCARRHSSCRRRRSLVKSTTGWNATAKCSCCPRTSVSSARCQVRAPRSQPTRNGLLRPARRRRRHPAVALAHHGDVERDDELHDATVSWQSFIDEIRDYLVNEIGIPTSALDSVPPSSTPCFHPPTAVPPQGNPRPRLRRLAPEHAEREAERSRGQLAERGTTPPHLGPGTSKSKPTSSLRIRLRHVTPSTPTATGNSAPPSPAPMRYRHTVYG